MVEVDNREDRLDPFSALMGMVVAIFVAVGVVACLLKFTIIVFSWAWR